jgi:RNA polymerase sigma-70 factor (ECF subfamily)
MEQDTELINKILGGDRRAFDQLFRKYYSMGLKRATRLTKDIDVAKEIVHNAYVKAYFCISNLKDKSLFKFWLSGIIDNTVKEYWRKHQRKYVSLEDYTLGKVEQEDDTEMQAIAEITLTAIKALPEECQVIVTMFYYEGLSIKEIAVHTQLTPVTIKVRLHRARTFLKPLLQKHAELEHYHQNVKNKNCMKKVSIADIIISGTNKEYCCILLQDEDRTTVFPIVITTTEAMAMVVALKNIKTLRPSVFNLVATMIRVNKLTLESVYIHDLVDGIFIAKLKMRKGKQLQELDARPSDAMTFALMFDSPICIAQGVLDKVGFPIPEKYKQATLPERGIGYLMNVIEEEKKKQLPDKSKIKAKTEQEIQTAIQNLIESAFEVA